MSFTRRGTRSDIYVYQTEGFYVCDCCHLDPKGVTQWIDTSHGMLSHLIEHQKSNHLVPEEVITEFERIVQDHHETRTALVKSKIWGNVVKTLDVMSIAKAGVINLVWLDEEHKEVRNWTLHPSEPIPKVIQEYIDLVKEHEKKGEES